MFFVSTIGSKKGWQRKLLRAELLAVLLGFFSPAMARALPSRLVLALDGIAYRDMQALQAGVTRTNFWGHKYQLRAFTAGEGYFPVSRMVSTFPSASDVAWTDIFGDRPLAGYQRTYFSKAANAEIAINGVTTTMEHEHQMDWQSQNGFMRALGYLFSVHVFRYELKGAEVYFWKHARDTANFYAYIRATDDCQHLDRDVFSVLCEVDKKLQKMRARYKAQTGRDLEIVVLSDHGHNHAGRGIRVRDDEFLKRAGYHVGTSIHGPKDVVLPVVGIENWVEVHCQPDESQTLSQILCGMEGVDLIMTMVPGQTNRFLVLNAKGERADILWRPAQDAFSYVPHTGDPLKYQPAVEQLKRGHKLDADGFATADIWANATMAHRYPLALQRIVRGLTHNTLNPATILVNLDNRYVNAYWLTDWGSRLVTCRSTHGGLDELSSVGIVMSNFQPTHDASTENVAEQFGNFTDVKDFRASESGAEWVTKALQSRLRIAHVPFDRAYRQLSDEGLYLRVWSPLLTNLDFNTPVIAKIKKDSSYFASDRLQITFDQPVSFGEKTPNERVYEVPADLKLEPFGNYDISLRAPKGKKSKPLVEFNFSTDQFGRPAAY